jgi:hypothetical protein
MGENGHMLDKPGEGHHHLGNDAPPPTMNVPPPAPVPTVYQWGTVRDPTSGGVWVMLTAHTNMGKTHLFFDGQSAVTVGEMLAKLGQGAKSGLVIPT